MNRSLFVAFLSGMVISLCSGIAQAQPTPSASVRYIMPTSGVLTSPYGMRYGRMHQGIDIGAPMGTPIVAAASGTVAFVGTRRGYGHTVELRHSDSSWTRYAHNSSNLVHTGQQVDQGQQIATVGQTGYATGPHCHFEIRLPGRGAVDPMAYLGTDETQTAQHP